MSSMNYRVSVKGEKAEDVAREYLRNAGIIKKQKINLKKLAEFLFGFFYEKIYFLFVYDRLLFNTIPCLKSEYLL